MEELSAPDKPRDEIQMSLGEPSVPSILSVEVLSVQEAAKNRMEVLQLRVGGECSVDIATQEKKKHKNI